MMIGPFPCNGRFVVLGTGSPDAVVKVTNLGLGGARRPSSGSSWQKEITGHLTGRNAYPPGPLGQEEVRGRSAAGGSVEAVVSWLDGTSAEGCVEVAVAQDREPGGEGTQLVLCRRSRFVHGPQGRPGSWWPKVGRAARLADGAVPLLGGRGLDVRAAGTACSPVPLHW